jgi:hypothetical protein
MDKRSLLFNVLCNIEDLAGFTPVPVAQSEEWAIIISSAEESREYYCKSFGEKTLFSVVYATYIVTPKELTAVLKSKH